ncbi:MAG: hypothetical protein V3V55_06360 [Rhodospirillales bacterium]
MISKTADPFIENFFGKIPKDVARTFSDAQLDAVKMAFGARSRGVHAIDIRASIPLIVRRFYFVLLAGPEHRPADRVALERALRPIWTFANVVVIVAFLLMFLASLGASLYAGKRALGIDIFPGFDTLPDKQIERLLR